MNVKFRVSYKIGKKGTLVAKKKISINDTQIGRGLVRTRIHSNTNSNLDIELLIYFHRPKLI